MNPGPEGPREKGSQDTGPQDDDLFGPDTIEESLTAALNDLEKILDGKPTPGDAESAARESPDPDLDPDSEPPTAAYPGEQYTIPLLNDVVIPGIDMGPAPADGGDAGASAQAPAGTLDHAAMMEQLTGSADGGADSGHYDDTGLDEAAVRRKLAERLASEVEVLVQARLESALNEACEDIREQVRNHLDIILPEIVEDMLQHRHHRND